MRVDFWEAVSGAGGQMFLKTEVYENASWPGRRIAKSWNSRSRKQFSNGILAMA
jgi:hypothetical protein